MPTWWKRENFESIHNHSAYALIERDKKAASRCGLIALPPMQTGALVSPQMRPFSDTPADCRISA